MPLLPIAHSIPPKSQAYAQAVIDTIARDRLEFSMYMANSKSYSNPRVQGSGDAIREIDQFIATLHGQTLDQKLQALRDLALTLGTASLTPGGIPSFALKEVEFGLADDVMPIAFSPDGKLFITSGDDSRINVRKIDNGQLVCSFPHPNPVYEISFSPNGQLLGTACEDALGRIWDVPGRRQPPVKLFQHQGKVYDIQFSRKGSFIATASEDTTAILWDASTRRRFHTYPHQQPVLDLEFSPDERWLATVGQSNVAFIWDTLNGAKICDVRHQDTINGIASSPDGKLLATASSDMTAGLWDTFRGQQVKTFIHSLDVNIVAFSPCGKLLATASNNWTVGLWDTSTGHAVRTLPHNGVVTDVMFLGDGRFLATISGACVRVWDVNTGKEVCWHSHMDDIDNFVQDPNGTRLLTFTELDGVHMLHLGQFISL